MQSEPLVPLKFPKVKNFIEESEKSVESCVGSYHFIWVD